MIKLCRIDHRLVHGQVAFSWTKFLDSDCILIASDNLMKDDLKMTAMKMAKPNGVKLVMKNMQDSITALNSGVTDKYKLFIIVESVKDAYDLTTQVDCIKSINIGGMKAMETRRQISKAVFVDEADEAMLKDLDSRGIELEVRLVPSETKRNIIDLL